MTAEATGPEAAAARRARTTIGVQLGLALAVLALILGALGALTVWGVVRAREEVRQAEQSLVQIETVQGIEAAFNRYLLAELGRRLSGGGDPAEHPAAGDLRGAILTYRIGVAREIEAARTDAERASERAEMSRASALSSIFETVETEAMLDRVAGDEFDAGVDARQFAERIAGGRDDVFRAVLREVLADERAEAVAAFGGLERLSGRVAAAWTALALALVAGAAGFALLLYRRLMRPIASLAAAAEGLGGTVPARVPADLPGEFAGLARRFNEMAGRIETEQGRLQAEVAARTAALEAANAQLRAIDAARRQFFANVGHELRTPVTVLLGEAQIALRGTGGEREALERIAASGGFLRRRLDDLMRLARSEDGQLALSMGEADLAAAVVSAAEAARAYAEASEIALVLEPPGEGDWRLGGDEEALTQAALALIDNAVKFTPPGGEVRVRTVRGDGVLGFEVADTGPGFEGDPEALFDRYAQASAGRAAGGSGLGLAIVRWIADAHGGRVTAARREGGGALLRVELPVRSGGRG